jgi:N-acetylglucosamine kinase-like BadF-type ATPase
MTAQCFLGVDVGSTKTHALIANDLGQVLGFSEGGSGNHQSVGYDGLRDVLLATVDGALTQAGLGIEQIAGAGFGIGGYDWPSQLPAHLEAIEPLGLKCPLEVANDSIVGLMAGASQGWGLVLIAGTGNNCRGRDRSGREGRITGEGGRFGEFGGAVEMVERAIQQISYEWTRRGPRTALTRMFMERAGADSLDSLIEGIDLGRYRPDAGWAPGIFEAARAGDAIAREIVAWSGRESGESACGVIRQLRIENEAFDVILAGSVFAGGDLYIGPLQNAIHKLAPKARLVKLEAPPVVGGVVLGMQKVGLQTASIHGKLVASTRSFVGDLGSQDPSSVQFPSPAD